MTLLEIEVTKIMDPAEPVRATISMESVDELAESIRELGLIQPIVVREQGEGYEVIAGHRRLLAVRRLGMERVQCLLADAGGEDQTMAARLHENLYRVDLTPLEEAAIYAELYEKYGDTDKVATLVRRARATVERRLSLLDLDDQIREALSDGKIGVGVAELLQTVNAADTRRFLLDAAIHDGASVEKVRLWCKDYRDTQLLPDDAAKPGGPGALSPAVEYNPMACWLCGSAEDPHELRVKRVHYSCERMMIRKAEHDAEMAKTNEQQ